jgi:hypothetical protein
VVLPLLRRYFLISRGFEYFVGPALREPIAACEIEKPIHSITESFLQKAAKKTKILIYV